MTEFIFDIAQNFRQYLASSSDISAISICLETIDSQYIALQYTTWKVTTWKVTTWKVKLRSHFAPVGGLWVFLVSYFEKSDHELSDVHCV